jgi:hypothetical protein
MIGDLQQAQKLFERHFDWAYSTREADNQLWFYRAGRRLLASVAKRNPYHRVAPSAPPLKDYTPAEISVWLDRRCLELAIQFDLRNGNLVEQRALKEDLAEPNASVLQ